MEHFLLKKLVLQRYPPAINYFREHATTTRDKENANAFLKTLVRAFEEGSGFSYKEFHKFPTSLITDYIGRTHFLYLNKSLQEIEQSISLLNEAYHSGHPLLTMLNEFYLDYKCELVNHIREEDEKLLPYVTYLEKCMMSPIDPAMYYRIRQKFSISIFMDDHKDNDFVLDEIRSRILSYDPPPMNRFIYKVLLNQLEFFACDLRVHGLIEDHVLVPRALEMEDKTNDIFLDVVGKN